MGILALLIEGLVANAPLFLPWERAGDTVLLVLTALCGTFAFLFALLLYWPGAVACALLGAMLFGLLLLARAARRREARTWRPG